MQVRDLPSSGVVPRTDATDMVCCPVLSRKEIAHLQKHSSHILTEFCEMVGIGRRSAGAR